MSRPEGAPPTLEHTRPLSRTEDERPLRDRLADLLQARPAEDVREMEEAAGEIVKTGKRLLNQN